MQKRLAQEVFDTLFRIFRIQRHQMHPKELTPGETFVLFHIHHRMECGGVRVSDIASKMKITTSGVTQFVKGLEIRGLVDRRRSDEDRRVVMLHTTERGDALMNASMQRMVESFTRLVEDFGNDESTRLRDILQRVADFLDEDATCSDEKI